MKKVNQTTGGERYPIRTEYFDKNNIAPVNSNAGPLLEIFKMATLDLNSIKIPDTRNNSISLS